MKAMKLPACPGCGGIIHVDRLYLLTEDCRWVARWHLRCYRCSWRSPACVRRKPAIRTGLVAVACAQLDRALDR